VRDNQNQTPPFTHNLSMIAARTNLNLIPEQEELLLALNQFNIRTRYPDYKLKFYKKCTYEFTMPYFNKIKEFYKWLLQQI
jgi:HEPN domain-containing protein